MKEKTKLRVIQILCIVSLLITVFSIQMTYAKYFEKIDTTYDTTIKRWAIKVNNSNIHTKNELSEVMQPTFRTNEHMNGNNTLIPGREGYFEFLIDYTNVDVTFRYQFDIKQLNDTPLEDFEIYGYSIVVDGTETITEITQLSEITQVINPIADTDGDKTRQLRVLFRWNDENADTEDVAGVEGMNNEEDTAFAGTIIEGDTVHTNLNYKVTITFTQQV